MLLEATQRITRLCEPEASDRRRRSHSGICPESARASGLLLSVDAGPMQAIGSACDRLHEIIGRLG